MALCSINVTHEYGKCLIMLCCGNEVGPKVVDRGRKAGVGCWQCRPADNNSYQVADQQKAKDVAASAASLTWLLCPAPWYGVRLHPSYWHPRCLAGAKWKSTLIFHCLDFKRAGKILMISSA